MDIVTDKNTVTEIKSWLDAHGIDYPSSAQKADLLKLVPGESEDNIAKAESEADTTTDSQATDSSASSSAVTSSLSSAISSESSFESATPSSAPADVQPVAPESSSAATQPEPVTLVVPDTSQAQYPTSQSDWADVFMPGSSFTDQVPSTQPNMTYKVQPGDTVSKVANMYGMSVAKLKNLNGLSSNLLYIGRVLTIE